ncbi:MAG: cation:proton antiporter [Armatimonadaceae bacterium]
MHGSGEGELFLGELGIVLLAALVGGFAAQLLRLPVLIGYLVAGIAVGPHTPGFIADEGVVSATAELGIVLLMFAVGVQFSLEELRHARKTALTVSGALFAGTLTFGILVGLLFQWGIFGGIFLGCALFLSSTAVVLRMLDERGELGTTHGSIMLGVLIVQDLSFVLMVLLLPAFAELNSNGIMALQSLGVALLKAVAFLGVSLLLATRLVPALLERIARNASRELFLVAAVCLCLLTAFVAEKIGLGLALGAFMAGLVISESPYAHEVFSQVRPLRDVFSSLFFVSVGMLLDPAFMLSAALPVAVVAGAILIGKPVFTWLGMFCIKARGRTTLLVSLGLAQIGEFSFVLAQIGAERGLVDESISRIILSAALITLLCTPFWYQSAAPLYFWANHRPMLRSWLFPVDRHTETEPPAHEASGSVLQEHVVVVGYGRVGRYVSDALRNEKIAHVVVDYDANLLSRLKDSGVRVIYGDATAETVLRQTRPQRARLAIVALPEAVTSQMVVEELRKEAPNLPIVVRVHRGVDIPRMRKAGATEVVHAEFEAGTEMIRQGLTRLNIAPDEIRSYIGTLRQHRYRHEE